MATPLSANVSRNRFLLSRNRNIVQVNASSDVEYPALMSERGGSGKNDPNRTAETPSKGGQQSQNASHQSEKGTTQQGGSDHRGAQQSQGGSRKDSGQMKQGGTSGGNDAKKGERAGKQGWIVQVEGGTRDDVGEAPRHQFSQLGRSGEGGESNYVKRRLSRRL
jgi:hypothetical protein